MCLGKTRISPIRTELVAVNLLLGYSLLTNQGLKLWGSTVHREMWQCVYAFVNDESRPQVMWTYYRVRNVTRLMYVSKTSQARKSGYVLLFMHVARNKIWSYETYSRVAKCDVSCSWTEKTAYCLTWNVLNYRREVRIVTATTQWQQRLLWLTCFSVIISLWCVLIRSNGKQNNQNFQDTEKLISFS
jgi:hypothetical protein